MTGILLVNVGNGLVPLIERDRLPTLFLTTPDDLNQAQGRQVDPPLQLLGEPDHAPARRLRGADPQVPPRGHHRDGQRLRPRGGGGFQRVFEDAGGKVVQKLWVPLNVLDFAPYLSQVAKDVDAVCAVFVAGQAVRFVKQYGEAGLKEKTPLIGTGS